MHTLGLLGGMTWHSTVDYYRLINQDVQTRLGGSHSARCVLYSVEFQEFEELQTAGDWKRLTELMTEAALKVQTAGAEALVICANTMHKTADTLASILSIPILHIVDAAAAAIVQAGLRTVGLLGTRYTMEMDFYRERLEKKHGLTVLIPDQSGRDVVHDVIYPASWPGARSVRKAEPNMSGLSRTCAPGAPRASSWAAPRSRCS